MAEIFLNIVFFPIFEIPAIVWFFTIFAVWLSIYNKLFHIRKLPKAVEFLKGAQDKEHASSFGILVSCIGTVLGIGNIVGGSMAVKMAGPGVLFWILIVCLVASSLKFFEAMASIDAKNSNPEITGNASYFIIKERLGGCGKLFALIYIFAFIFGYFVNGLFQVNQIFSILDIGRYTPFASILIAFFILFVLKKGIKIMSHFMIYAVPVMLVLYLSLCMFSIAQSANGFIKTAQIIINDAFSPQCATIGFAIGYAIRRLCFAADLGTGLTGTMVSGLKIQPYKQGVISVLEVVFVGLSVFITGFTVVASGLDLSSISGVGIIKSSVSQEGYVQIALETVVFLFGVTTACSCGMLAERGILVFKKPIYTNILHWIYAILTAIAVIIPFTPILNTLDSALILAAMINIPAIFMSRSVFKKWNNSVA